MAILIWILGGITLPYSYALLSMCGFFRRKPDMRNLLGQLPEVKAIVTLTCSCLFSGTTVVAMLGCDNNPDFLKVLFPLAFLGTQISFLGYGYIGAILGIDPLALARLIRNSKEGESPTTDEASSVIEQHRLGKPFSLPLLLCATAGIIVFDCYFFWKLAPLFLTVLINGDSAY